LYELRVSYGYLNILAITYTNHISNIVTMSTPSDLFNALCKRQDAEIKEYNKTCARIREARIVAMKQVHTQKYRVDEYTNKGMMSTETLKQLTDQYLALDAVTSSVYHTSMKEAEAARALELKSMHDAMVALMGSL
jgi:multidrug resistance efflux pump